MEELSGDGIPRKLFNLAAGKGLLLQLAKDKRKVWWPTPPTTEVFEKYAALDVACVVSEITVVLGAAVGFENYRRSCTDARVDELTPTFNKVALLEDGHVALSLLRACIGASCFKNLLRVVPPEMILGACKSFESTKRSRFTDILRHPVPDREWELAQQPLAASVPALGLAAATAISPSALIASWEFSADMVRKVVRHLPMDKFISEPLALLSARAAYSAQVASNSSSSIPISGSFGAAGGQTPQPESATGAVNGHERPEILVAELEAIDEIEQNEAARPDHVLQQRT